MVRQRGQQVKVSGGHIMSEEQALRLVELEIKRNRVQADLEAIQAARQSVRRSMESYIARHDGLMDRYAGELGEMSKNTLDEQEALFQEWHAALGSSTAEFGTLVSEWERIQVQEQILIRMLSEIDRQIEEAKLAFQE
jgi:seryl-tRNA synthetase